MKLFVAFAIIIAGIYTLNITQFHPASLPKCFMQLLDSRTSKSRLACLQMCRSHCIFVDFNASSKLCNRYQYGTTTNCAAGNSNYINVYKKVSPSVYKTIGYRTFVSWTEAQKYCIHLGGCLSRNNFNLAELVPALSNEMSVQGYLTEARKLDGLGWIWLNGDNVSITPIIDDSAARCLHVLHGDLHDIACDGIYTQYFIFEVW